MSRKKSSSLLQSIKERETQGELAGRQLAIEKHTTIDFVNRLGLYMELQGHEGCVNCLDWNTPGSILASGSDDQTVILWSGSTGSKLTQLSTDHEGNIFSVKFLPDTGDRQLVTGAQDSRVCLLDVEKKTAIQSASIHIGRVKRLAVAPDTSGVFWSAAEDGTVMQWDTREKWEPGDTNVLINLVKHVGKAEVKCIAVNPTQPELIAIGANDPYVRIYDRRKLTLQKLTEDSESISNWERRTRVAACGGVGDDTPLGAVSYFVPGHLPILENKYKTNLRPLVCTYLAFSERGNDMVTHLGGEHVYYYDKFRLHESEPQPSVMQTLAVIKGCDINPPMPSADGHQPKGVKSSASLPVDIEKIKAAANAEFEQEDYTAAICLYNVALCRCQHAVLYGNRAAAFIKRDYCGDMYSALRDCVSALRLQPAHVKALLRLVKCLHELDWVEESSFCLDIFRTKHPDHVKSQAYRQLEREVSKALDEKMKQEEEGTSAKKRKENTSEQSGPHAREDFLMDPTEGEGAQDEREGSSEAGRGEVEGILHGGGEDAAGDIRTGKRRISKQEVLWRRKAVDYTSRFIGACNTTTDIKEANFFGSNCQFIVAGSDDGRILIWDKQTTNLVKVLDGDSSTVNCVQGHPTAPVLASSGIDAVVRLWNPRPVDGTENVRDVKDLDKVIKQNQKRMTQDPFEYFMSTAPLRDEDIQCRPS